MRLKFICAAAIALGGCMKDRPATQNQEAALMQTSRDWSEAAQARDIDAVLGYFADDATMISAGQPALRGKQAIRASLEEAYKVPGFAISWEPLEAKVSGDMGYMLERTRMTMNGPGGEPMTQTLQGVTIWRKADDGSWKNVVDVAVAAPANPPS